MRGNGSARTMPPRRLPDPPGKPLAFRWGRRRMVGGEGDTVASALLAGGARVLSRSIKYHRPRSYLCGVGKCANCLCTIDGKPSQRACLVPLRAGMRVEPQNAWPSAEWDVFGLTDAVFAREFDPQRAFTRPAFLRPLFYTAVRHMAGLGRVPRDARPAQPALVAREQAQLAVVGAGAAGLAAAWEACRAGVDVRVYDEQPWPGGRLALETQPLTGPGPFEGRAPRDAAKAMLRDLDAQGLAPLQRANVAGVYGQGLLAVQTPQRLTEVRAEAVILAPGAPESLPMFGDNDRPGVVSATGAAVLLHRHRVLPGQRVVLVGREPRLLDLGRALAKDGAHIEALVSPGEVPGAGEVRVVRGTPRRALGTRWVRGVEVQTGREVLRLDCDLVVLGEPRRPAVELAQQAGAAVEPRDGAWVPRVERGVHTTAKGVLACGDLLGPTTLEAALASGRVAGLRAAQVLGAKVDEARLADAEDAWRTLGGSP